MHVVGRANALDRQQLVTVGLHGQRRARADGIAIHEHRARAADATVAVLLRALHAQHVADELQQRDRWLNVSLFCLAVDGYLDVHLGLVGGAGIQRLQHFVG